MEPNDPITLPGEPVARALTWARLLSWMCANEWTHRAWIADGGEDWTHAEHGGVTTYQTKESPAFAVRRLAEVHGIAPGTMLARIADAPPVDAATREGEAIETAFARFLRQHEADMGAAFAEGTVAATKAEREACAKIAEQDCDDPPSRIAAAIRARGDKPTGLLARGAPHDVPLPASPRNASPTSASQSTAARRSS